MKYIIMTLAFASVFLLTLSVYFVRENRRLRYELFRARRNRQNTDRMTWGDLERAETEKAVLSAQLEIMTEERDKYRKLAYAADAARRRMVDEAKQGKEAGA